MPGYRLSTEAVADLESIGEFGIAAFGLAQALKYLLALESRFELLAQFPRVGLSARRLHRILEPKFRQCAGERRRRTRA
jgi:plasmid stabilization system protein ParE